MARVSGVGGLMKNQFLSALLGLAMLASSLPAPAASVISGYVAQERVNDLMAKIEWNTDLYRAMYQAQRQGKLVMWVHMLGSMSGAT